MTLDSTCFHGCYKDLVELIGNENTIKIHNQYSGQYLMLPKKLLSDAFIHQAILDEYDGANAKALARKYGYTYSWMLRLLKRLNNKT